MKKSGYAKWFCIGLLIAIIAFDIYLDRNEEQSTISQWVLEKCRENPHLPLYIGFGFGVVFGHITWPQKRKG
jgi:hypothetical protein